MQVKFKFSVNRSGVFGLLGSYSGKGTLRRRAPQLIVIALIVAFIVYIAFEIVEDVLVEGASITSGPLIGAVYSFTRDIKNTVLLFGYYGIFGLMLLEASSLPVPSEAILPLAGYLVSQNHLDFWLTVSVATIAAISGSLIDFYIGRKGIEVLRKRKILGRTLFSENQLNHAQTWFDKYGGWAVFLGRLVPGFRTLISFPAGAAKMQLSKFVVYTLAGCLIWNSILVYVGYYLGVHYTEVAGISHYLIIATLLIFAVAAAAYIIIKHKKPPAQAKLA